MLPPFAFALFAGGIYFKFAVFFALIVLYYEVYRLISNRLNPYAFLFGILAISVSFWKGEIILSILLLSIFGVINYLMGFSAKEALMLIAIVVFVLIPAKVLVEIREISLKLSVFLLTTNWMFDTGAYLFGKFLGKRKIFTNISPGKTLEGLVGGLVTSASIGGILGYFLWGPDKVFGLSLTGFYIGLLAQSGDLLESALKREKGVKDSGKIMPGHGGLFDRVDSLLVSIMGFYVALRMFREFYL
ncbi:putative CDP-diglyceride synthetase/phosphatidate cytidylyltransferase [Thiovulum sp. ES]|nr:putative CDP-diglyceride synthetase/phosphatidate cytidylyltransferase [Thiovulum sp. ES]